MMHPNPWDGPLDPDEKIIWQGHPEPGVRPEWDSSLHPVIFGMLMVISIFWMIIASNMSSLNVLIPMVFFGTSCFHFVGIHFWKAHKRRGVFYPLTNKRTYVGKDTRRDQSLNIFPILPSTPIKYLKGPLSDIWFDKKFAQAQFGTSTRQIGFERLKNGPGVNSNIRKVQRSDEPHSHL